MKILIVANGKLGDGRFSHFVNEQVASIQDLGVELLPFKITRKGIGGYVKEIILLRREIRNLNSCPVIIHAHSGLCGFIANMQRTFPVVTTYHGSDIHSGGWRLILSKISMNLSKYNIFVSSKLMERASYNKSNSCVLPCGIDVDKIYKIPRLEALKKLKRQKNFVLFSGSFSNPVKNYKLAQEAMQFFPDLELVELEGYNRDEVCLLMNAARCLLMTSVREGSPQVIKEAMACGTPIVSVDVGDVKEVIGNTSGCFIAEYNAVDVANKIRESLNFEQKTNGRERIIELGLDNKAIAQKIINIYSLIK